MRTASARGLSLGFQQNRAHFPTFPPCVAFNNHAGSTKSFDYVREHNGGFCAISTMTQTSWSEWRAVDDPDHREICKFVDWLEAWIGAMLPVVIA
jgi:hypothetical protein